MQYQGAHNFIFLVGIIGGVLFSGLVKIGEINIFGVHQSIENILKDAILIIMGLLSLCTTKQGNPKEQ